MASSKEGVTATLGTFAIDLQLKIDYKMACIDRGVSMTDELTGHIRKYVDTWKKEKAKEEPCGSINSPASPTSPT